MKNIFHIGYHKTATTWFQRNYYKKVRNYNVVERKKIARYFYENKIQEFNTEEKLIFCDEELSGNIHNGGYSGLLSKGVAESISDFDRPQVIIFIRNQYDIITSSYLQYVKKGGNYSLNRYLYHKDFPSFNRTALFSFSHFNYLKLINYYNNLVGKDNVNVYLYEDFLRNKTDFLKSFGKKHNFDVNLDDISFEKSNKSYSYLSLFLARILNSFSRKDVLYKYYLIHIPWFYELSSVFIKLFNFGSVNYYNFLGKSNREYIYKYYKEINKKLKASYNLDLEKYNYPL